MRLRNRIEVMHGVNLDQLGRRDPEHYGGLNFDRLEQKIGAFARELGLTTRFFQTNSEEEFVGIIMNPGAWTHYSYAIRDALEIAALPTVEVHLSDVDAREEFRRISVVRDICFATVKGRGVDGYREALHRLKEELRE
jgi:3-dehydroquinate dehydratase-2